MLKKMLFVILLLAGLGCTPRGYRSDSVRYTLYRSRMMMPESSDDRRWAPHDPPGSDFACDEQYDLSDAYTTFSPQ